MDKAARILVVDDEPAILSMFSTVLRLDEYEVLEASTGRQALQLAREQKPDVILLDVRLPDLDGIAVCHQVKTDAALADTFVVLLSGEATSPEHKVKGLEIGADDYISKPIDLHEFRARVRTVVRLQETTAALRASEQHYRRLVEIMPDAVTLVDLEGHLCQVNHQALVMFGYSNPAELLQKNIFDLMPLEEHAVMRADMERTLQTGTLRNAEYRFLRKQGEPFAVEVSAGVLKGGRAQPVGLVSVIRDITERKRAEEQIRLLADALQSTREMICITDEQNAFTFVNRAFLEVYGYTEQEILGHTPSLLYSAQNPPGLCEEVFRDTLAGGWSGEIINCTKGGSCFPISLNTSQIKNNEGKTLGLIGVARDISERKNAEQRLADALELNQTILAASALGIMAYRATGQCVFANEAAGRILNTPIEELLRQNFQELPHWKKSGFLKVAQKTLREAQMQAADVRVPTQAGEELWLDCHMASFVSNGEQHLLVLTNDITERKWATNLLQVQRDFSVFLSSVDSLENAARQLVDLAIQRSGIDCAAVYVTDDETGALLLTAHHGLSNRFVQKVRLFPLDSARGRHPRSEKAKALSRFTGGDLTTEIEREGLRGLETIPLRQGRRVLALLAVGSHHAAEIPASSAKMLEAVAAHAGAAMGRIRAEQSLRDNRELLEKALHSLRAAVFVVEAESGTILECNPAATRIFGFLREEMLGHTLKLLHLDEQLYREFTGRLTSVTKAKGFLADFEFMMRRKEGSAFPTEHSVVPMRNDRGQVVSWVNLVRDITERKQAEEEARQLPRRIIEAQEAERLRVARELHDGVNQLLAAAKMRLRKVEDRLANLNPAGRELLARCEHLLVQALEENRRIAHNLRPSDLDALGLAEACRNFCTDFQSRTNLAVHCSIDQQPERLAPAIELNLFRIVQEALNNVEKHAHAKTVQLGLAFQTDGVALTIEDDGRGFNPAAPRRRTEPGQGIGLTNMRERAAALGGIFEIESLPNKRTTIRVRVPNRAGDKVGR